ncbi:MAG: LON peptidase substrate-binding domain-containing protein [Planctomycetota bacterium]
MQVRLTVNFSKPVPLFPLAETVLLPHAAQRLHIFEPRYRQMVEHCLDTIGQVGMACYDFDATAESSGEQPVLRPAICIGQIVRHERLHDGRFNIELLGVCRAAIEQLDEPIDDRLYRQAIVRPLESIDEEPPPLPRVRDRLRDLLEGPYLRRFRGTDQLLEWLDCDEITTQALLEVIGFAIVTDNELRYQLLAESDVKQRASMIMRELHDLRGLVTMADQQGHRDWPKGLSWN